MSKVLQERGFGSLLISTETTPSYTCRKEKDLGSFTLPCYINNVFFKNALADLGARVSVMPLSTYLNLGLGELAHTKLTVELADKTVKHLKGIAENVLVGIGKFIFPIDFIILDMSEDVKVPLILERPFCLPPMLRLILEERMELDLEARLMGETLVLNRSLDPLYGDYIELNDLNVPLELRRDQVNDLIPTIEEVVENIDTEIKTWEMSFSESHSAKPHVWKQEGDENPIRTLGDYSRPSHEGYRNTIELPDGNNVVPLRSDTIPLVQNGSSFHELWSEDPNPHLKDFLKLVDSLNLDVANRERTRMRRTPKKVLVRIEARHPITKNVNVISLVKMEKKKNIENNKVVDKNVVELSELNAIKPKEVVDMKKDVEDGANDEPVRNVEE
ncbi:zinc finger, CCHC-type containing protein [Tanacetum coccineum]